MNEVNENERQQDNNNYFCINLIVLIFSSFLMAVDIIEWKRLLSAWRFSINQSQELFNHCYEKDLDYRTVSLFFSTLLDIFVFYFFFIMIFYKGNKLKPIKIGFSISFYFYGTVLFCLSSYALYKWKDYVYVCDKEKLISYYLYYGVYKNNTLKDDLVEMEKSVTSFIHDLRINPFEKQNNSSLLFITNDNERKHRLSDNSSISTKPSKYVSLFGTSERDLKSFYSIEKIMKNKYLLYNNITGEIRLNKDNLHKDYLRKNKHYIFSYKQESNNPMQVTDPLINDFDNTTNEYDKHFLRKRRKNKEDKSLNINQSRHDNSTNTSSSGSAESNSINIFPYSLDINQTLLDIINLDGVNNITTNEGYINKSTFEHIIINTKIVSGLYITNLFISFTFSLIIVIIFGTVKILDLYKNSYQNNYKANDYLSKIVWKGIIASTKKQILLKRASKLKDLKLNPRNIFAESKGLIALIGYYLSSESLPKEDSEEQHQILNN